MSTEKIYLTFVGILVSPGIVMLTQYANLWGWALIGGGIAFALLLYVSVRTRKANEVRTRKANEKRWEKLIEEISELLTNGNNVCNLFNPKGLPDGPVDKCLPIQCFKDWVKQGGEILLRNKLQDWKALFFADTSFRRRGATANTYIQACKAGLKRLEEFLGDLRNQGWERREKTQ